MQDKETSTDEVQRENIKKFCCCLWNVYWLNPSSRTVTLELTEPLTEMSTRDIFLRDKDGRCIGITSLPLSHVDCLEILGAPKSRTPVFTDFVHLTHFIKTAIWKSSHTTVICSVCILVCACVCVHVCVCVCVILQCQTHGIIVSHIDMHFWTSAATKGDRISEQYFFGVVLILLSKGVRESKSHETNISFPFIPTLQVFIGYRGKKNLSLIFISLQVMDLNMRKKNFNRHLVNWSNILTSAWKIVTSLKL
jgi:hypothetical protein